MKNAVNWFAIPAADFNRAVKFYNAVFDFSLHVSQMGGSVIAFFPVEDGGIGGHISKSDTFKPSENGPLLYLNGGEDLQKILDRVESAGGKITYPKTQITPEIGYMGIIIDSEGNRVGLHSPK
ncbi:MAG TPA: VOC family protein [Ignavibacteria bacterium]|nr:VOC family protein [Ignavibacteria bacterium]